MKYLGDKMKKRILFIMVIVGVSVFTAAFIMLLFGDYLDERFNVIGIRVATLFIAFTSFISSTAFSFLVYFHNRTVSRINDDANRRAELFRELQFASSNYSIIEFMDRMKITQESTRYIEKFILNGNTSFHMLESNISEEDVIANHINYSFISVRIPFKVVEGKMVSHITLDSLTFERNEKKYTFITPKSQEESRVFILYNEMTKRNNVIINLVFSKESDFFHMDTINYFSKIKIRLNITSLLGVRVKGISELYFTNPEQIEGEYANTYKITSSNFTLSEMPKVIQEE